MAGIFVGCSILEVEIKAIMQELQIDNQIEYIDAALHVDLDLFEKALYDKIRPIADTNAAQLLVLIGTRCHPNLPAIVDKYQGKVVNSSNCIELLLGETMAKLDSEAKTFYLTIGWLKRWRDIFIKGLGWDSIDARINFGMYDRIIVIDTGLIGISEEEILDFFDYCQVPIETYTTTLDHLKKELLGLISENQ